MYRNLGLDLPGCAKLLHVTERTLHNWESGKHDIPFAAYKLLRLLNRMELPGDSWDGWCFHGGKLWTPEGRQLTGKDGSWWSLLVRQAAMFVELVQAPDRDSRRRHGLEDAPASGLVSVSTSCTSAKVDITDDIKLTSNLADPMILPSYQIDYGLISCPTPSAFLRTLKQQPESGPQASGLASTPSFVSVSMPMSMAQPNPPLRPERPGLQAKENSSRTGVTKLSSSPLPTSSMKTASLERTARTGGSLIRTRNFGPLSIQTPNGPSAETKSLKGMATLSKPGPKHLSGNTGPHGNALPMSNQEPKASQRQKSTAPSSAQVGTDPSYRQFAGGAR
ncbi:uncharacterized protein DUF3653 [Acidovorax sp. 69]|nr:uncharacterized protein DUF3653 [Acidovorax sp. 69]